MTLISNLRPGLSTPSSEPWLNLLGYARQTVAVDLLLSSDGLERFRDCFVGRGYVPAFPGAQKSFRDSDTGIRIHVIRSGEYPGDGKPKPVSPIRRLQQSRPVAIESSRSKS